MKSISIRDLRQKWPEAESLLQVENEIIITRDSKPVARLVRYVEPEVTRQPFDPVSHGEWQRKVSGGKVTRLVEKYLKADREDRDLSLIKE